MCVLNWWNNTITDLHSPILFDWYGYYADLRHISRTRFLRSKSKIWSVWILKIFSYVFLYKQFYNNYKFQSWRKNMFQKYPRFPEDRYSDCQKYALFLKWRIVTIFGIREVIISEKHEKSRFFLFVCVSFKKMSKCMHTLLF